MIGAGRTIPASAGTRPAHTVTPPADFREHQTRFGPRRERSTTLTWMLDDLDEFARACAQNPGVFTRWGGGTEVDFVAGDMHYPGCGGPRPVRLTSLSPLRTPGAALPGTAVIVDPGLNIATPTGQSIAAQLAPAVISGRCVQDDTGFTWLALKQILPASTRFRRQGLAGVQRPGGPGGSSSPWMRTGQTGPENVLRPAVVGRSRDQSG